MNTSVKLLFFTAIILILIGAIIFTIIMSLNNWDFRKLSTFKYETNSYEHTGEIKNIIIETTTADITIVPIVVSVQHSAVECYELENASHSVSFENGNLVIKEMDNRQWYNYIGINLGSPKITIYVPFQAFDKISIQTSTGDISAEMLHANEIALSVSTGDIALSNVSCTNDMNINVTTGKTNLSNVKCENLTSTGNTGNAKLNDVIVRDTMTVKRSTGDVQLEDCDAHIIDIKASTGDVTGSLLTGKVFTVKTSTGRINVPENSHGGTCNITTTTGNIRIFTYQ